MNKIIKFNFNDHRKVLIKTFSKLEDKIFFAADLVSRALANKNLIPSDINLSLESQRSIVSLLFLSFSRKKEEAI